MTQKIYVSKRSILEGKPGDPWSCPVSLAVRKALKVPVIKAVGVDGFTIYIRTNGASELVAFPPRSVRRFIRRFDRIANKKQKTHRKDLKAFSFNLIYKYV